MTLTLKDRVKETSTSTGTGNFVLDGAVDGFQSFTSALTDGDTTYYAIEDGTDWETGLGTWTEATSTLARTTVYESSNSNNAVDWGAGSKNVFITQPASRTATIAVYPTIDDLPLTGNVQAGDQAYVSGNNRLYLFNGNGWYNIALVNETPSISGNEASYTLATDGTPTTVTMTGTDPEGIPIIWSATTSGDTNAATVTNTDNVFTITPSTDTADAGVITVTFRASDGVNIGTSNSEFTLAFLTPPWADTVLSIGTSSTNGLDNSTFIDRSTNAHTVTPTGTPVQTAFHPYLDNWSVEFDGTGDYLRADGGLDDINTTTHPFTLSFWIYPEVSLSGTGIIPIGINTVASGSNILLWRGASVSVNNNVTNLSSYPVQNEWTFVELIYDGVDLNIFHNGANVGTVLSITFNASLSDCVFGIGCEFDSGNGGSAGNFFTGYISNLRVLDFALESSVIPTEKLTAVSGTSLLTCQSNRFIDNSTNAHAITVNGDPKISAFNPFGQGSEYAVGENKGSVLFPSTSDYLLLGNYTLSGDFCFKFWTYIFDDSIENWWVDSTGTRFLIYGDGAGTTLEVLSAVTDSNNVTKNQWAYIEVSRSSGQLYLFKDGQLLGQVARTTNYSGNFFLARNTGGSTNTVDGYISDFYFSNGTAGHTASYTAPTAPVGNTDATIYLPFDNAGIVDKTGLNTLTLNGDASTSTTQTKFADTSMYFDGSGDYLSLPESDALAFGTGDFTIEFWVNPNASSERGVYIDMRGASPSSSGIAIYQNASAFNVNNGGTNIIGSAGSVTQGQFQHVALTRESGSCKLFVNGSQVGITVTVTTDFVSRTIAIGAIPSLSDWNLDGYIENFQILKGVAKYTANFTPPNRTQGITYQAES